MIENTLSLLLITSYAGMAERAEGEGEWNSHRISEGRALRADARAEVHAIECDARFNYNLICGYGGIGRRARFRF